MKADQTAKTPWSKAPVPPPDPRIDRPTTLGEARRHIEETYADNGWDAAAQARFHKMIGLEPKDLQDYEIGDVRRILDRMERSRMILYRDRAA